jgi:2-keto-4-pentenoate hydratase/2-oxohepta-3-ene-1,7-dioic acid hydratase in catechol pathway
MRLLTYEGEGGAERLAIGISDAAVADVSELLGEDGWTMACLLDDVPGKLERIRSRAAAPSRHATRPVAALRLLPPVVRPGKIVAVGRNYREHAAEESAALPTAPLLFAKFPSAVVGDGATITWSAGLSAQVDYEAELAVVIGLGGRNIARSDAMRHVFGYTIVNDVTARDWQSRHMQWHLGKSFDTFCPMGPWLVSADECDGTRTQVRCYVNGEERQNASTTDLIFDIPTLIETLSAGITLYPGDVIATGTPVGVGIGFKPPKYLKAGDVVRVEIDGIGALENPVR